MDSSQVLALKYRPKSFSELIGQESISQTLSHALTTNRLSHAYLFSGLRGSGKTSTARIFSKSLVCQNAPTASPCEVCSSCMMANEGRHIDIIEMDAASNRKIDDIRELIEHTKYRPSVANYKIFIIDEVHMLTKEAFNALLKTLEEPPSHVKFILATTDPLKLPATILSRTQHFRFKQISRADIVHHLSKILDKEEVSYELDALEMVARSGNGSLRDTLTLLDQAILFSKGDIKASGVAGMLGLLDPQKLETIFEYILSANKPELLNVIKELENNECESVIDEMIAYLKDRFFAQDARFSTLLCERFFKILSQSKELLFLNAQNSFVLSLVLFKMVEALHLKSIDEAIKELESVSVVEQIQSSHVEQNQVITASKEAPKLSPYEKLIEKIYDRDYDLGNSFEKYTKFISFGENSLVIGMSTTDEVRVSFRKNYAIIKHFIDEVFGLGTTLKVEPIEIEEKIEPKVEEAVKEVGEKVEERPKNILEEPAMKLALEALGAVQVRIQEKV